MTDPIDFLLQRISRSSRRLRVAMAITAVLCVLIASGIAADGSVWHGGLGWRIGGGLGVAFFTAVAGVLAYGAIWRQCRHIGELRRLLRDNPRRITSVRLMVARAVPYASWEPDDGSARTGLHVIVTADSGQNWVLPVSRAESVAVVDGLRRRCG